MVLEQGYGSLVFSNLSGIDFWHRCNLFFQHASYLPMFCVYSNLSFVVHQAFNNNTCFTTRKYVGPGMNMLVFKIVFFQLVTRIKCIQPIDQSITAIKQFLKATKIQVMPIISSIKGHIYHITSYHLQL